MLYDSTSLLQKDKTNHKIERHKFSKPEDERLTDLVYQYGTKKWRTISSLMEDRTPRQCRERWKYYLSLGENVNVNDNWSQEDDELLLSLYDKYGSKWSSMISYFKNQTVVSLKNRYNKLQRKSRRQHKIDLNCNIMRKEYPIKENNNPILQNTNSLVSDTGDDMIQNANSFDSFDYNRHIILPLPTPISCFMKSPRSDYHDLSTLLQV